MFQQRHRSVTGRSAEKCPYDPMQGVMAGRRARCDGRVDVTQAFFAMAGVALRFELRQHRADGGIARRIGQAAADVLDGCVAVEREQYVQDLAFASRQLVRMGRWHSSLPPANMLRKKHSATYAACQAQIGTASRRS